MELDTTPVEKQSTNMSFDGLDLSNIEALLDKLDIDRSVEPVSHLYTGGTSEAKKLLDDFIKNRFGSYDENRNQTADRRRVAHEQVPALRPGLTDLHRAEDTGRKYRQDNIDSYLEELIVRRNYRSTSSTTRRTTTLFVPAGLGERNPRRAQDDNREYVYTRQQLEDAKTHDEYWNAAMREMRHTGYMHNYMRMYWERRSWSGRTPRNTLTKPRFT